VMKNVMGMMMLMMLRHPTTIPGMMKVMPKMMDFSFCKNFTSKIKGVFHARNK